MTTHPVQGVNFVSPRARPTWGSFAPIQVNLTGCVLPGRCRKRIVYNNFSKRQCFRLFSVEYVQIPDRKSRFFDYDMVCNKRSCSQGCNEYQNLLAK